MNLKERGITVGDLLIVIIVIISSFVLVKIKDYKNDQSAKLNFVDRVRIIKSLNIVDDVYAEKSWDQKIQDILKHNINVFAIGDDWEGKFDFLKSYCDVVYIPRTENVSSTLIRGY